MKTYARLTLAWLIGTIAWPLAAQTAAPVSKATDNPAKTVAMTPSTVETTTDETADVIHLSPFEVTSQKDTGYQATQTLAGTRIRTDLKDVSAAISVLTKEFMNDVGATDSGTLLQYTTNAEVAGTHGTYAGLGNGTSVDESGTLRAPAGAQRIRGLAAADNARDYYITDIPWDSFNVDRIDVLRGPNSILYGLGSPAGIVNGSTKNAEFRNKGEVTARIDKWGSSRGTVDINQELVKQVLAIRVDGMMNDTKFEQKPAFNNDKRIFAALRFDPQLFNRRDFHTSIKAKIEGGSVNADRPRIVPPNDAISPWWRPVAISASNPFGGMGQTLINNPYDPYRTDGVTATNGRGTANVSTVNYQPYLNDPPNQQQPYWMIDGTTNQLYGVNGGYINNAARYSTGALTPISNGLVGKRQNGMFYGLGNLPQAVNNYNNSTTYAGAFPTAQYGQYRNMSLLDPSIFDFYHTLIDGPTKSEFEKWTAYNLDLSQTGWDDRVGIDLSYDRQRYMNGAEQLLGGQPTLTMSIMQNFPDYYLPGGSSNINVGRPFVVGAGGNGGSSYYSDREYRRLSLFGELRATDLTHNEFLVKLLGKQRFNAIGADEKYSIENKSWQLYANSQAWAGYWNGNNGATSTITDRQPLAMIYLGSPITGRSSPHGANIPGITAPVALQDHGVYVFDSTWTNPTGVGFGDNWNVPASMYSVYGGLPNSEATNQLSQASNPANYVGWNSNFQDQLLRYSDGLDNSLLTNAQKTLRETNSYTGSYQGYFWNNALVATLGWRYDEVKTKGVSASSQPADRQMLNLQPNVYSLPSGYDHANITKGHSTSGGAVLHLNNILPHDPLPFDISLSYNESSNFQVTNIRRDVYGTAIGNPTGKTYEYGLQLSTKDNKYSFRATQFTTKAFNGSSGLSNSGGIGGAIVQGLKWRNVFLYQLGGYDMSTANQPSYRNTWTNAYPLLTQPQADAAEDSAITTWNNIQNYLAARGFFQAWNINPTGPSSALVSRTTYLSNPALYAPAPLTVAAYNYSQPQGFTVTADTVSKGDEYELTANPMPHWRISANAAKTTAVRSNVGGATLDALVAFMNSQLKNPDGSLTPAGGLPQFGGASSSIYASNYGPWLSNYTLMKLQEGSAAPEIRKWRYSVTSSYDFSTGFLKGAGIGGNYHWVDKVVLGYPTTAAGTFDLSQPYYGPSEDGVDLWASYQRKLTNKINWKIQLNIRNAFNKDSLIPISIEPDGKTWASVRVSPSKEWFLTNTFSF